MENKTKQKYQIRGGKKNTKKAIYYNKNFMTLRILSLSCHKVQKVKGGNICYDITVTTGINLGFLMFFSICIFSA